jgi:hypothetical protein
MSEVFTDSSVKLRVDFSEIVLSEGREALTSGPCRLVVPISWKRLQESASSGRLTFLEVYIAKIFEVTIHDSTLPSGECVSGVGSSIGLEWSIFAGDSEGSKDGQKWVGIYSIPRKLACQKAKEYGLAAPESTLLNHFGVGTTQVDIPVLDISGDEKIDNWKKFVELFLSPSSLGINREKIIEILVKPDQQSSTYRGEDGTTVIISGSAGDASYTNIDSINRCLHIPLAANYSSGRYVWEDGEYAHVMAPNDGDGKYTLTITRTYDRAEISKIILEPIQQGAIYKGESITVIVTGFAGDASYTNIDSINRCLHIPLAANYSSGRYVWEDGEYTHVMAPSGSDGEYLLSVYFNPLMSLNQLGKPTFEGLSEKGDLQEAIADAIQKAKESLKTDFVDWKLNEIFGKNGGFVGVTQLKVNINASPVKEPRKP